MTKDLAFQMAIPYCLADSSAGGAAGNQLEVDVIVKAAHGTMIVQLAA